MLVVLYVILAVLVVLGCIGVWGLCVMLASVKEDSTVLHKAIELLSNTAEALMQAHNRAVESNDVIILQQNELIRLLNGNPVPVKTSVPPTPTPGTMH